MNKAVALWRALTRTSGEYHINLLKEGEDGLNIFPADSEVVDFADYFEAEKDMNNAKARFMELRVMFNAKRYDSVFAVWIKSIEKYRLYTMKGVFETTTLCPEKLKADEMASKPVSYLPCEVSPFKWYKGEEEFLTCYVPKPLIKTVKERRKRFDTSISYKHCTWHLGSDFEKQFDALGNCENQGMYGLYKDEKFDEFHAKWKKFYRLSLDWHSLTKHKTEEEKKEIANVSIKALEQFKMDITDHYKESFFLNNELLCMDIKPHSGNRDSEELKEGDVFRFVDPVNSVDAISGTRGVYGERQIVCVVEELRDNAHNTVKLKVLACTGFGEDEIEIGSSIVRRITQIQDGFWGIVCKKEHKKEWGERIGVEF